MQLLARFLEKCEKAPKESRDLVEAYEVARLERAHNAFGSQFDEVIDAMRKVPLPWPTPVTRTTPALKLRPYRVEEFHELLGVKLRRPGMSVFVPNDTATLDGDLLLSHCTFLEGPWAGQPVGKPVRA